MLDLIWCDSSGFVTATYLPSSSRFKMPSLNIYSTSPCMFYAATIFALSARISYCIYSMFASFLSISSFCFSSFSLSSSICHLLLRLLALDFIRLFEIPLDPKTECISFKWQCTYYWQKCSCWGYQLFPGQCKQPYRLSPQSSSFSRWFSSQPKWWKVCQRLCKSSLWHIHDAASEFLCALKEELWQPKSILLQTWACLQWPNLCSVELGIL